MNGGDPCNGDPWYGVGCDAGSITRLSLPCWGQCTPTISGQMPTEVGLLTTLNVLDFAYQKLTGGMPTEIGRLTALSQLCFQRNSLTGGMPTEIGMLTLLTRLELESNRFSGGIPTEVGRLRRLEGLYLNNNGFTGQLPTEVGNMSSLRALDLSSNSLNGTLPVELSNAGSYITPWGYRANNLWTLRLANNYFVYPTTADARASYRTATSMCPPAGRLPTCYGLPPDSCSAFAGVTQSLTDPTECSVCDGNHVVATIIVVAAALFGLLALLVFVRLTVRYPQSQKRWVSTVTILINQAQVLTLISSLRLQWPRSVELVMSALSFK